MATVIEHLLFWISWISLTSRHSPTVSSIVGSLRKCFGGWQKLPMAVQLSKYDIQTQQQLWCPNMDKCMVSYWVWCGCSSVRITPKPSRTGSYIIICVPHHVLSTYANLKLAKILSHPSCFFSLIQSITQYLRKELRQADTFWCWWKSGKPLSWNLPSSLGINLGDKRSQPSRSCKTPAEATWSRWSVLEFVEQLTAVFSIGWCSRLMHRINNTYQNISYDHTI